ncbi:PREDICTED: kelch domain-containing protein 10-like [Priapulus caudatus]|uniref:Kelch domain-containing protein 10-like n=1 Tax=Priapulus caudatus TaxID=37621 RepID=A0ABM1ERL3_PRICU|nr:PREDICTED: kelch domain-containing protein 10-like [Priapulus caudatus]
MADSACDFIVGKFFQVSRNDRKGEVKGKTFPEPRSGHRCVANDIYLYAFGGFNSAFAGRRNNEESYYPLLRELWRFNIVRKSWEKLSTGVDMPWEVASHCALLVANRLIVFGGTGIPFGKVSSNLVHVCDLKKVKWQVLDTTGALPLKGYGQAGQMLVFGGVINIDDQERHSELLPETVIGTQLIPEAATETQLVPEAVIETQLILEAATETQLILEAATETQLIPEAVPAFDLQKQNWEELPTVKDSRHGFPQARRCHSCVKIKDDVYMTGGYDGEQIFGDLWRLHLPTMSWVKYDAEIPILSYFHSTAVMPLLLECLHMPSTAISSELV